LSIGLEGVEGCEGGGTITFDLTFGFHESLDPKSVSGSKSLSKISVRMTIPEADFDPDPDPDSDFG